MKSTWVLIVMCISCGGIPSAGNSEDDRRQGTALQCEKIPIAHAEDESRARLERLAEALRAQGNPALQISHSPGITFLQSVHFPVSGSATDPGTELLNQLARLPASPFVVGEIVVEKKTLRFDTIVLSFRRANVGGRTAHFWLPAATAFLQQQRSGGWEMQSLTVYDLVLFATEDETEHLAKCTSEGPPPHLAAWPEPLEGSRFFRCGWVGTYSYWPSAADTLLWQGELRSPDGVRWEAVAGEWRVFRPARLTIAPENYWENIRQADCFCGGVAGFEVLIDVVTGARVTYIPGINCVVC